MAGLHCGAMDWNAQNEIVKTEAAYVPRGPRGSEQNIYRSVLAMARRNGLGRKPQIGRSVDAAHDVALRAVRRGNPEFTPVLAEPTLTTDDIERYLSQYLARQSVLALAPDFPRWLRRLARQGVGDVPLALGTASAQWVDLFVLQASRNPAARLRAHDVRDTLPALRPYKGR